MKNKSKLLFVPLLTLSLIACGENTTQKPTETKSTEAHTEPNQTERPAPVEDDKVHIIVLAGQSGARGKAHNSDLSDEEKLPNPTVDIIQDGLPMPQLNRIPETVSGTLTSVKPGFGDSASEFGPEIGMAKAMASRFPKEGKDRKSVIVKYTACGSTFTDHWYSKSLVDDDNLSVKLNMDQIREDKNGNPTGPLTNNLYQLVDKAIADLKEEGFESVIDGVVFCHGEQDAKYEDNMEIYGSALNYFMQDFRDYYNMPELPFVISEAQTNSARYSNKLREIQADAANGLTEYLSTDDLYTNTFEPWHFSAESNILLGERMAESIIYQNDNRKIESFNLEESYRISLNHRENLPKYVEANFSNGTTGIVPISYPDGVDDKTLGTKEVKITSQTNWGVASATMNIVVDELPYVDGWTNDWTGKVNRINDKVSVGFETTDDGLYVRAEVRDSELWTDGEAWETGDMGQQGENDDFELRLTNTTAAESMSVFLSSANLLRIYDKGINVLTPRENMVYSKIVTGAQYHVRTTGEVNVPGGGKDCTGMTMELYLPYEELGLEKDGLMVMASYADVSREEGKSKTVSFTSFDGGDANRSDISNYRALNDLI